MAQQGRGFVALPEDLGSAPGTQVKYFIPTVALTPEELRPFSGLRAFPRIYVRTHTQIKN